MCQQVRNFAKSRMGRIVGVTTAPIFPICRANCRAQSFSMIHESAPIAKTEGQDRTSNVREHPYWNSLSPNHLPCVGCLTYRYSRTSKRCIHPPPTPAHSLKSSDLDPTNGRSGEAVIVSSWPNPGRRRHAASAIEQEPPVQRALPLRTSSAGARARPVRYDVARQQH